MILGMTYKEVFYLILFIVFIIYISTPRKPRVRLGDVLMEYLPCTEADKVNLIKWIIVLKSGIPVVSPLLLFKGNLHDEAFTIARLICRLFPEVVIRQYPSDEVIFTLSLPEKTTLFPIPIFFNRSLFATFADEYDLAIDSMQPDNIIWPVKVKEGQDGPVIYHQGEL